MPKLIKKNIIDKKYRLLTILLIFTCIAIFTSTLSIIFSLVNGMYTYVGGGGNELIILSSSSRTPFTGTINLNIVENITRISGVSTVSPELPVPVYVNGSLVILRGVDPKYFTMATNIKILKGRFLNTDDYDHVVIGRKAAEYLDIEVGDRILVTGVLKKSFGYFIVDGIFNAPEPYSSEVLTILPTARVFRGVYGNFSSLIRVIVEEGSYNTVKRDLRETLSYTSNKLCSGCGSSNIIGSSTEAMSFYLHKYGFDINVLYIALIPSIIISIFSIKYLVGGILDRHRQTIKILHDIGYSYKAVRLNYMLQTIFYILISSIMGFATGLYLISFIWRIYDIRFLIHIPLNTMPIETLILGLTLFTFIAIYYFYSGWKMDEEH